MFKKISIAACVLACGLGSVSRNATAQQTQAQAEPRHRFAIGVGEWGSRSPLEGTPHDDAQTGYFPWISYENKWLSLDPSGLAVHAFSGGQFALDALLAPRWVMIDPRDSAIHGDLRRRISVDAGAKVDFTTGPVMLSLSYRGDVSGRVNGHEVTAEAGVGLPLPGGGNLGIKGGAYWRDDHLNTWLYGVRPGEARADRPAFQVKQGFTPFAGLRLTYPVIGGVQAMFAAEAQYLPDSIAASPIIARRVVPSAMLGLFYTFGVQ